MTCEVFEVLLCDYLDGTLAPAAREELTQHMAICLACAELAQDAGGAMAFIERSAEVEPPAELITRIVVQTRAEVPRPSWWSRFFAPILEPIRQPKFAMSMALTILSFSMVGKLAGIPVQNIKPSDMDPVKVWTALDVRAHHAWERVLKYYEGLRFVYEVQTRLKDWTEPEEEERRNATQQPKPSAESERKNGPGVMPPPAR